MPKPQWLNAFVASLIFAAATATSLSAEPGPHLKTPARGNDFAIDWFTVDAGGELFAQATGGSSQVSGTLAQWDAAPARPQVSGPWEVTGGFWGATTIPGDTLFEDSMEGPGG